MRIVINNASMPLSCWICGYEKHVECPCSTGEANASLYKDSRHPDCPVEKVVVCYNDKDREAKA